MNLPLLGVVNVTPVPAGAGAATLLTADDPDEMKPVVDLLTQTRKSLTLRSLFMTGFPHDPEFFAAGVALARQWSRQGLKVAVVDLDFRHPTVVRPRPHANEGFVDALEYGCSFQRIAWELVADALWLVGPGSHPPDEQRFAEHTDWARVMRIFSARADVTLYLAPFLDRKGFSGALSKRMDGVLLAASVRRSSRTALRDAFLELWGSDAPMIGCLGLEVITPHGEVLLSAPTAWESAPPASAPPAVAPEPSPESAWEYPKRASRAAADVPRASPPSPPPGTPREREIWSDAAPEALVSRLSDEVRRGDVRSVPRQRTGARLLVALLMGALVGAGAVAGYRTLHHGSNAPTPAETLPAGTERVLPADVGTANPGGLPGAAAGTGTGSLAGVDLGAGDPKVGEENPFQVPGESGTAGSSGTSKPAPPAGTGEAKGKLPYRVHVASFRSESKVREIVKDLRKQGLDAWYAKATDQADWYRVFVGHYATHEEAVQKAAWLLNHGWVEHAMAYPDNER